MSARIRHIVTPEGVDVPFALASPGQRLGAFLTDFFVMVALLFVAAFGLAYLGWVGETLFMLFVFVTVMLYHAIFEMLLQGRTLGKLATGIRVMDARGGPLTGEAIFTRNLTRQIEFWVPLGLLLQPDQLVAGGPAWLPWVAFLWVVVLAFFPLFNGERRRIGDLFAGTMVVRAPKQRLLQDLGGDVKPRGRGYEFPPAALEAYGIYELQVLEEVLRRPPSRSHEETLRAVLRRIQRKIEWKGSVRDPEDFLRAYYAALRAHLEKRMLLGDRKEDKFS